MEAPVSGTELQPDAELFTINMGPHHPATHGVLRLLLTLEGENVLDMQPIIGYVHTGIEKSCEDQAYWKVIPFVERMDYLAYYFNAMAFCMSVERLLDLEVPPRAQYLRVIHLELNRIASHLFWLATSALDLGAVTMLWWGCRERDYVLDLFEYSSGQRFHTRYFQVGGVIEDIPPGWDAEGARVLRHAADAARPVRGAARPQRDLRPAPEERGRRRRGDAARPRRDRAAAARDRQPVGPAQGDALLVLRPLRLQDPGRHDRRQLRPLPRAHGRDARVGQDRRAGARRACPRARTSPTTARSRCRRGTSWPPRWRR